MNRDREPREPGGESGDGVELVELHETRLPTRLDVPPTSVASRARPPWLDPRIGAVIAVVVVGIAILGTGPLAPQPRPSPSSSVRPSPSSFALESSSPEATDACIVARPPTVSLSGGGLARRTEFAGSGEEFGDVEVVAPVLQPLELPPGTDFRVGVSDARCVGLVGVDVIDTSRPTSDPLTVRAPAPFEPGERSVTWNSPPNGDWIVRVALRLRQPDGLGDDGTWFVYLFRLNSGYVAWALPVPEGVAGGGTEGPLVTPSVPCATLPSDLAPPAVELHAGGAMTSGIVTDYQWRGTTFTSDVADALAAVQPTEIDGSVSLKIAGDACATNWSVDAGLIQADGAFRTVFYVDGSPENPSHDPRIAAQNVFSLGLSAYGTYVLRAAFDFENGDREAAYWLLHAPLEAAPVARAIVDGSSDPVQLVQGCGIEFNVGARYGVEVCDPEWLALPEGPTLELTANSVMVIGYGDESISGWQVQFASREEIEAVGVVPCAFVLSSGYSGVGLASLELPPFPPGQWVVRVSLSFRGESEDSVTVPYFIRVSVAGEPLPLPTPMCGGDV